MLYTASVCLFVCLSVCLSVCLLVTSRKTTYQIFIEILSEMYLWTRTSPLIFGMEFMRIWSPDPDYHSWAETTQTVVHKHRQRR